jgi:hypothetical protein
MLVLGGEIFQQLSRLLGYEVVSRMPCNQFISQDGSKPFACIPDHVVFEAAILQLQGPDDFQD